MDSPYLSNMISICQNHNLLELTETHFYGHSCLCVLDTRLLGHKSLLSPGQMVIIYYIFMWSANNSLFAQTTTFLNLQKPFFMSKDVMVLACACWLYKLKRVIYHLITDRLLNTLHHFKEETKPFKMTIKTSGFF